MSLTAERLRQVLHYSPETGDFIWLQTYRDVRTGLVAGSKLPAEGGRVRIQVDGRAYKASRLAWLYMTGAWPALLIDHVNRDPTDNRWINLREVTVKQNRENSNPLGWSGSGRVGVTWDPTRRKWAARLCHSGRNRRIGMFKSKEEAISAREKAERDYFTHAPSTSAGSIQ